MAVLGTKWLIWAYTYFLKTEDLKETGNCSGELNIVLSIDNLFLVNINYQLINNHPYLLRAKWSNMAVLGTKWCIHTF